MKKYGLLILILLLLPGLAMAHPGGVDANSGHRDKKNVSGLGSYHYHCQGTDAHQHVWGLCPYRDDYQEYKTARARMGELLSIWRETPDEWNEELRRELCQMICHEKMPFRQKEELLGKEDISFAVSNIKGLNIRKKPKSSSTQVEVISVTGSPVLLTGAEADGWYPVLYWKQGKNIQGYVMAKYLESISFEEYALLLYEQL